MSGLLALAFAAGMLATVNPCGFAMLPAFIGYYLGHDRSEASAAGRIGRGLAVGAALSAGFAAVFTVAGLLVAVGLRQLVGVVPWAAAGIGAVLVVVGAAMLAGRQLKLTLGPRVRAASGTGLGRMAAFGAAYAIASLSCTLAILLAVVAQATATAGLWQLIGVFAAYATGAALVLIALAITTALAQAALARQVKRLLPIAGRLGGALLAASGLYLILYWWPAVTGTGARPAAGPVAEISRWLTGLLEAHQGTAVIVGLALAALGALAGLAARRWRRVATTQPADPPATLTDSGPDCCPPTQPASTAVSDRLGPASERGDGQ